MCHDRVNAYNGTKLYGYAEFYAGGKGRFWNGDMLQ